eukprot:2729705-Amphidinium_carterae.1
MAKASEPSALRNEIVSATVKRLRTDIITCRPETRLNTSFKVFVPTVLQHYRPVREVQVECVILSHFCYVPVSAARCQIAPGACNQSSSRSNSLELSQAFHFKFQYLTHHDPWPNSHARNGNVLTVRSALHQCAPDADLTLMSAAYDAFVVPKAIQVGLHARGGSGVQVDADRRRS